MNLTQTKTNGDRIVWLDVIRSFAILMVIGVHCIDPFYISPAMRDIPEYTQWAAIYGSFFRPSVPLFTMMTGLLLLPVRQPMGAFYKKRISRILFPVLIWSFLYNMFPWFTGVLGLPKEIIGDFFCYTQGSESQALGDALKDVAMIPFQFSFKENHMWYMYLLLGLYLYMPFFSAWIEPVPRHLVRLALPALRRGVHRAAVRRQLPLRRSDMERLRIVLLLCRVQRLPALGALSEAGERLELAEDIPHQWHPVRRRLLCHLQRLLGSRR